MAMALMLGPINAAALLAQQRRFDQGQGGQQ